MARRRFFERMSISCATCTNTFIRSQGEIQKHKHNYCSKECYWESLKKPKGPLKDRFFKYVRKEENGCWTWTGSSTHRGYGQLRVTTHKLVHAHRVSYELFIGKIPKEMCVLHTCDVRVCVNPQHLWLGTNKDNTEDMMEKGRWRNQHVTSPQRKGLVN